MKSNIIRLAACAALTVSLAACDDNWKGDEPTPQGGTAATLQLKDHLNVEVNNNASRASRASYDLSGFNVKILNSDGSAVKDADWTYAQLPGVFTLNPGDYSVKVVSSLTHPAVAWDAPYFEGSKTFSIAAGEIKDLGTVTCNLANLKVTVKFTPELLAALDDDQASVDVRVNDSDALTYGINETRSGYYLLTEGNQSMVAEFTGMIDGNKETMRQVFTENVKPGYHRIITFGIHKPVIPDPDPSGTVDPSDGITIDVTVTTEDINSGVTVEEDVINPGDNPGGEGGDGPVPPTPSQSYISIDLPEGSPLKISQDANDGVYNDASLFGKEEDGLKPVKFTVKAKNSVAHFKVTIISTTLTPDELANVGLADSFDLENPVTMVNGEQTDLSAALSGLGFPVGSAVLNSSLDFDISEFIPLLAVLGEGTSTFQFTVTDSATGATPENFYLRFEVK